MYKILQIEEILSDSSYEEGLIEYKLCYIDKIPKTYSDWSEESKKLINSPEFNWKNEDLKWKLRLEEYDNPDFIPESKEYYAYFTPINLREQWGDDWNDIPYEHNAGRPYDSDNDNNKITIILIPFYLNRDYMYPEVKFPEDYGGSNSPFSVENINLGAVPWIFIKGKEDSDVIQAGVSPFNFCKIIEKWKI